MIKRFKYLLPLVPIFLLGCVGAVVRGVELTRYIDPYTNLYHATGLMAWVLPLLSVFAAGYAIFWGNRYRREIAESFFDVFATRCKASIGLLVFASILVLCAGVLKIVSVMRVFFDTWSYLSMYQGIGLVATLRALSVADLVYGLITCCAGVSILLLTKARYLNRSTDYTRFFATIPIFWVCFVLIMTFMEHPVEPVFQIFAYDLLGAATMVLAVYNASAMLFGKLNLYKSVVSSFAALYLIAVTVGGRAIAFLTTHQMRFLTEVPFRMVVFAAMFGYILVNTTAILKKHQK